jgi:hypothetical protein
MLQKLAAEGFPAVAADAHELPYALKAPLWEPILAFGLFGVGGLALAATTILNPGFRAFPWPLPTDLLCVLFWAVCALRVWRLSTPYLILYPDHFEKREIQGWRRIMRSDIAGIGTVHSGRNGRWFLLYRKDGSPVRLPGRVRDDAVAARWLAGAPDLDAQALAADHAAVLADPRYGASEQDRAARLALARMAMLAFNGLVVVGGVALWASDRLDPVGVVLALAPLAVGAAIVVGSRGLVVWWAHRSARPWAIGAAVPFALLAVRLLGSVKLLDPQPAIGAAVVVALTAGILAVFAPARTPSPPRTAVLVGVLAGLGAFGALLLGDVCFDTSPAHRVATAVEAMHVDRGRTTSYHLRLAAWDDHPAQDVSVGAALYGQTNIGDEVCVAEHPGILSMAWFRVAACDPAA